MEHGGDLPKAQAWFHRYFRFIHLQPEYRTSDLFGESTVAHVYNVLYKKGYAIFYEYKQLSFLHTQR